MQPDLSGHAGAAAGAGYAAAFSASLLEPERETPALVSGPAGKAAAKRYNVYRNNVTVSLIDALAEVYPAVQRITGVEFFRAMARFHIRETPPTSPLLFEFGLGLPGFHRTIRVCAGDAVACRHGARGARLARRLSRGRRRAADGVRSGVGSPSSVLANSCLRRIRRPGWLRSRFAAVTIFVANRAAQPVGEIDASKGEDALITRPELDVVVRRLAPGEAVSIRGRARCGARWLR